VEIVDVWREFGAVVASYVDWLTDQSRPEDGNRAARKQKDRDRIRNAPPEVHSIKCADLISNTSTIVKYDPEFAKVYLKEKRQLLEVLTGADPVLLQRARQQIA
jgi:guanosine-3',5'-bis(diphosphate) 3'-pyrophosphohydrolase